MKKDNGLSNCAEITIAKITIQNLSDFCNGKLHEFRIYLSSKFLKFKINKLL